MKTVRFVAFAIAAVLSVSTPAADDPPTGTPLFGSFDGGGLDTVSLSSLNVGLQFPIAAIEGRGLPLTHSLFHNSLMWKREGNLWVPVVDDEAGVELGWRIDKGFVGNMTQRYITHQDGCLSYHPSCPFGVACYPKDYQEVRYFYKDPNGTIRDFPSVKTFIAPLCVEYPGGEPQEVLTGTAGDGSGYSIDVTNPVDIQVRRPDGSLLQESGVSLRDSNGNYIAVNEVSATEKHFIDTLGRSGVKKIDLPNGDVEFHVLDGTKDAQGNASYQVYTLRYDEFDVMTKFQCTNVGEFACPPMALPVELELPTGQSYAINYEQTPGYPNAVTGRVAEVVLPTGAKYQYEYFGDNMGIDCSTGTALRLKRRIIADGVTREWVYDRSTGPTTVTLPQLEYDTESHQQVYSFDSAGRETDRKLYSGAATGTPLKRVATFYSSYGLPETTTTYLHDAYESKTEVTFDSYGNVVERRDFGLGPKGGALTLERTTVNTYLTDSQDPIESEYLDRNITGLISSTKVYDGDPQSAELLFFEEYLYDEDDPAGADYFDCADRTAANHSLACSDVYRGNLTTVRTYVEPASSSESIEKHTVYDDFGNVVEADPDCCKTQSWTYTSATEYAFPEVVEKGDATKPAEYLSTTLAYDPVTYRLVSATDSNLKVTRFDLQYVKDASGNVTDIISERTSPTDLVYTSVSNPVARTRKTETPLGRVRRTFADTLGRVTRVELTDNAPSPKRTIEAARFEYDSWGRPYRSKVPQVGLGDYWTETQYDALGRVVRQDTRTYDKTTILAATTYGYDGETVTVTSSSGDQKKYTYGGLGWLLKVTEPDPEQNDAMTLETHMVYDGLGRLLETKPVDEASGQFLQVRTRTYDGLSRLTSATVPETGATVSGSHVPGTYTWDYDDWGNVLTATDPRGAEQSMTYDALNRLETVTHSGPQGMIVPDPTTYTYGQSASANEIGRLKSIAQSGVTWESYGYDGEGRRTSLTKSLNGTTYQIGYQYDDDGAVRSVTYPSGTTLAYDYDDLGFFDEMKKDGTRMFWASFNDAGLPSRMTWQNYIELDVTYRDDTLQVDTLRYHKNGDHLKLEYGYGPTAQMTGQVKTITESRDFAQQGQMTYTYDSLQRLKTADWAATNSTESWSLAWDFDQYGNMEAQNVVLAQSEAGRMPTPGMTETYDVHSNRFATGTYDDAGNLTAKGGVAYEYDAAGRLVTRTENSLPVSFYHDPMGMRYGSSDTASTIVRLGAKPIFEDDPAPDGQGDLEHYYALGQLIATCGADVNGDFTDCMFYHPDHLSNRMFTDESGNDRFYSSNYPYGEAWEVGSTSPFAFTSYERDWDKGEDYAMYRTYTSGAKRFTSVDPISGSGGAPQTLNRFAYVGGDPVNFSDPIGLQRAPLNPTKAGKPSLTDFLSGNVEIGSGGVWVQRCYTDSGAQTSGSWHQETETDQPDQSGSQTWEHGPYTWCETFFVPMEPGPLESMADFLGRFGREVMRGGRRSDESIWECANRNLDLVTFGAHSAFGEVLLYGGGASTLATFTQVPGSWTGLPFLPGRMPLSMVTSVNTGRMLATGLHGAARRQAAALGTRAVGLSLRGGVYGFAAYGGLITGSLINCR